MKRFPRTLLSAAVAAAVTVSMTLSPLAAVIGEDLYIRQTEIHQGTTLSQGVYWGVKANDKRTENYITYTPNSAVRPIITYGDKVTSTSTVSAAAKKLEAQGYRVIAGINGDYYYTANGVPMGMIVTDGVLRSGYNKTAAIGFFEDGSAILGEPQVSVSIQYTYTVTEEIPAEGSEPSTPTEGGADEGSGTAEAGDTFPVSSDETASTPEEGGGETGTEGGEGSESTTVPPTQTVSYDKTVTHPVYTVNKARSNTGIFLYTNDFNPKGTNGCTEPGFDVVLVPAEEGADASLRLDGTLELVVESAEAKTGATAVPEGKLVLSVNDKAPAADIQALKNLTAGTHVTLRITTQDPRWAEAAFITSGYKVLVENGAVASGLDTASAPRTAIGQKEDGSLVFYTIDGRQSAYSVGASETLLAQRLQQLGCVSALCLDGGGSTTLAATLPESTAATLINKPSGGSERAVSTHIFLVADNTPTGVLDHYAISPVTAPLLAGAQLTLTGTAVDSNYIPMQDDTAPLWSAERGTITEGGLYTAPAEAGTDTITLSGSAQSTSTAVQIVSTPDSIVARSGGNIVTALNMAAGETCSLELSAVSNHMTLISQNRCFRFEVTNNIGTITEDGLFTATGNGPGEIIVRAGECTLSIPVTVQGLPFTDVPFDAWYTDAVRFVYDNALMNGMSDTTFSPHSTTTRAMIVQILYNRAGRPEATYAGAFTDVSETQWYTPAVEWAAANGIVNGVGNGRFDPMGEITREQMAIIFYNYATWVGYDTTVRGDVTTFSDAAAIHSWAAEPMAWAVGAGLMQGSGNQLTPLSTANRGQIAQMLMNFETIFKDAPIAPPTPETGEAESTDSPAEDPAAGEAGETGEGGEGTEPVPPAADDTTLPHPESESV